LDIDFNQLEQRIEYVFSRQALAVRAMTHPSLEHEHAGGGDYQRLEFLGDAVLGMLLAEALYSRFPEGSEGDLSRIRAQLAGQDNLAGIARQLGLGQFIRLGRGEQQTLGRDKDSILADVLESLIGAVYLDGGLEPARKMMLLLFEDLFETPEAVLMSNDSKSALQEILSSRRLSPPCYRLLEESGPPHDRMYRFQVLVDDAVAGEGKGRSKKSAQQAAASMALVRLGVN